jgi:uncharacterized Tic20 family protein
MHPKTTFGEKPENENENLPSANFKVILLLTIVFSLVLIGLTAYAAVADKELMGQVLRFVEGALLAILAIVGGKTARNILGR